MSWTLNKLIPTALAFGNTLRRRPTSNTSNRWILPIAAVHLSAETHRGIQRRWNREHASAIVVCDLGRKSFLFQGIKAVTHTRIHAELWTFHGKCKQKRRRTNFEIVSTKKCMGSLHICDYFWRNYTVNSSEMELFSPTCPSETSENRDILKKWCALPLSDTGGPVLHSLSWRLQSCSSFWGLQHWFTAFCF